MTIIPKKTLIKKLKNNSKLYYLQYQVDFMKSLVFRK